MIVPPSPPPAPDHLARARAEFDAGRLDRASALCGQRLEEAPDDVEALDLGGAIALASGRADLAVTLAERALTLASDRHDIACRLGLALERVGRRREARSLLSGLLARHPYCPGVRGALAQALLPGATYLAVLGWLHELLRPAAYLEIGVEHGGSLALALPPTLAMGIDPAPAITHPMATQTRIFATTSDDFFATQDLGGLLEGRCLDLAFIDGLHTFDQALRDFSHLERHASPRSMVAFHDVLPLDELSAARVRRTDFWTGDTWKILPALRRVRPDLVLALVPASPSGLLLVTGLDPSSVALDRAFDEVVADLMPQTFADWQARRNALPPVVTIPNRRVALEAHLSQFGSGGGRKYH